MVDEEIGEILVVVISTKNIIDGEAVGEIIEVIESDIETVSASE